VLVAQALAGASTFADIGIRLLANIRFSEALAWTGCVGGSIYGLKERRLRHQVNEKLGTRVSELEAEIDANRSSSKLTRSGQTHPRDSR
jgi:hypothetical protein